MSYYVLVLLLIFTRNSIYPIARICYRRMFVRHTGESYKNG